MFGGWQKLPLKIKLWCSRSPNISTAASHCPLSKLTLTPRAWGTSPDLQVSQMCAGTSVDAKRSLFLGSASHRQEERVLLHHTLPTPSVLPKCMGEYRLDPLKPQARTYFQSFEFLTRVSTVIEKVTGALPCSQDKTDVLVTTETSKFSNCLIVCIFCRDCLYRSRGNTGPPSAACACF